MFGISGGELAIVLVFGFLLFGPDKLPQMGRTIGRALRQFRETQEKLTAVVQTEVVDPMAAAVQAPAKPKKSGANPTGATVDTDDLDADIADDAIAEPARKKETFAERRARLAAEKAEKEAASAKGDAPVAESEDAAEASATPESAATAEPIPATESAPAKDEEPAIRTTEDLYARRPRKKKVAAEAEPAASATEPATEAAAPVDAAAEGGEQ